MRNLQASPWSDISRTCPQLVEIKASEVNKRRLSEFNLNFNDHAAQCVEEPAGKKPARAKKG